MATSSQTNAFPLLLPAPGWLFFVETLPVLEKAPNAIEEMVLLSLESHAPLPIEHLAYGWCLAADKRSVLYYAGARERLRPLCNGLYEKAGQVVPDFVLAPPVQERVWQWIATPHALTALRRHQQGEQTLELRSWPLGGEGDWKRQAQSERKARMSQLEGEQSGELWLWAEDEIRRKGKNFAVVWKSLDSGKIASVPLPVEAAWHADVRERGWLNSVRKARQQALLFNRLLVLGATCCLAVVCLGGWLWTYHRSVTMEANRLAGRQAEVDAVLGKSELVSRLDEMEAGRVSFYDALATLNHYRPTEVLFTRAVLDTNRRIQVHGTGASIGQINSYIDSLRRDGSFTKVETPRINTQNGQTTFNFQASVGDLRVSRATPVTEEEILERAGVEEPPVRVPLTEVTEVPLEEGDIPVGRTRRVFRLGGDSQITVTSDGESFGPPRSREMRQSPENTGETSTNIR